jgi:uncharacterized protein (DUF433 family)
LEENVDSAAALASDSAAVLVIDWRKMEKRMNSQGRVVVRNLNILGGTPVFRGTRVPLQLLFDSLKRDHPLQEFLEGYPTVSREMAIAALEEAQQLLAAKA